MLNPKLPQTVPVMYSQQRDHASINGNQYVNKPASLLYKESLGKPLVLSWLYNQDLDSKWFGWRLAQMNLQPSKVANVPK